MIIYIALFTIQIVSKQLYSIKQENSVSKEPKLHRSCLARWNQQFPLYEGDIFF